jgi:hypothetical protein
MAGYGVRLTNFLTARSARLDHFSASTSSEHLRQAAHIPDPHLKKGQPAELKVFALVSLERWGGSRGRHRLGELGGRRGVDRSSST